MKRLFLACATILTLIFANSIPAFAVGTNNFYFKSFEGDYRLVENGWRQGDLEITEKLVAVFPNTDQNHGIDRCIPANYKGEGEIKTSSITVYQNGLPALYTTRETSDDFLCLRIGSSSSYVHGEVEYEINYTYKNVIVQYLEQDYQELYWDTNGTSWKQPFGTLTARLHLSQETYEALVKSEKTGSPFSCYVGAYGESGKHECTVTESDEEGGKVITFKTSSLSAGENLTMDAMFALDTFNAITQSNSYILYVIAGAALTFYIVVITILLSKRNKQKEKINLAKDKAVPVQYTPLKGVSVAEMAEVSLKNFSGSSNVATLMELATTHKIELEKGEKKRFGGYHWNIHVKNLDETTREQTIVLEILNGGKEVKVGDTIEVKSRTSTATMRLLAQSYREKVNEALQTKGLFEKTKIKESTKTNWVTLIVILLIMMPFMFFGVFITLIGEAFTHFSSSSGNTIYLGASYILPALLISIFVFIIVVICISSSTSKYKKRTLEGIKASKYLDGLKEYMELAEKDRIEFLQSVKGADTTHNGIVKLYEKLLPYAIIFGIEESWMDELNKYYKLDDVTDPEWVTRGALLSASDFRTFNTYTRSAISSSTMSESSGSSGGSSGGGGGGFSGGGGGGGGGGGW